MRYFRSKVFDVAWVLWTMLFVLAIPILIFLGSRGSYVGAVARTWSEGTFFLLKIIVRLSYVEKGIENIPHQRCMIISNHQSPWETLFYLIRFPRAAIVAKSDLLRIPVFGWYLKNFPMIVIDRDIGSRAMRQMIEGSREAINNDRSVLMFPEGTRKSVSDKVKFRRGVEFLYSELNIPVLLIVVNSGLFWGPDKAFKNDGTVTVSYLPPILPGLPRLEFKRRAEEIMQSEKETLLDGLDIAQ